MNWGQVPTGVMSFHCYKEEVVVVRDARPHMHLESETV